MSPPIFSTTKEHIASLRRLPALSTFSMSSNPACSSGVPPDERCSAERAFSMSEASLKLSPHRNTMLCSPLRPQTIFRLYQRMDLNLFTEHKARLFVGAPLRNQTETGINGCIRVTDLLLGYECVCLCTQFSRTPVNNDALCATWPATHVPLDWHTDRKNSSSRIPASALIPTYAPCLYCPAAGPVTHVRWSLLGGPNKYGLASRCVDGWMDG
jgi:hypothetical protein